MRSKITTFNLKDFNDFKCQKERDYLAITCLEIFNKLIDGFPPHIVANESTLEIIKGVRVVNIVKQVLSCDEYRICEEGGNVTFSNDKDLIPVSQTIKQIDYLKYTRCFSEEKNKKIDLMVSKIRRLEVSVFLVRGEA